MVLHNLLKAVREQNTLLNYHTYSAEFYSRAYKVILIHILYSSRTKCSSCYSYSNHYPRFLFPRLLQSIFLPLRMCHLVVFPCLRRKWEIWIFRCMMLFLIVIITTTRTSQSSIHRAMLSIFSMKLPSILRFVKKSHSMLICNYRGNGLSCSSLALKRY